MINSLMYVMMKIRLDIAYAMFVLSRFDVNSNKTHFVTTKYVLRYLKGTLNMSIIYDDNDALIGYIDAN